MLVLLPTALTIAFTPRCGPSHSPVRRCRRLICSTATEELSRIAAAPATSTAAFDLAEQLSMQSLPHGPWRHAFRQLLVDDAFLKHGWANMPFKLDEEWSFAIGSYTMDDVERGEKHARGKRIPETS